MNTYSTDADLAKWEPALFRDLTIPGQRLCRGDDGSTLALAFSSPAGRFLACGLKPGHVLRLWSPQQGDREAGVFEILSVESQTQLLATQVGMAAAESPVELPAGQDWAYAVDSFQVQAEEVAFALLERLGISTEQTAAVATAVLSPRVLRRASVFGVLAMVHQAAAGIGAESGNLAAKAALYRDMHERELAKLRVTLDRDGDGLGDEVRLPGSVRLRRG